MRTLLGNQSILISSGYRCPELNAAVGSSRTSTHMVGMAADLTSPPLTALEICRMIEASPLIYDQLISKFDWVHFAIGPQQRRQVLTYYGNGYTEGLPA